MAPEGQAARAGLKAAVSVWACSGGSGQGSGPSLTGGWALAGMWWCGEVETGEQEKAGKTYLVA